MDIERIKNLKLESTQIVTAESIDKGIFLAYGTIVHDNLPPFLRVVLKSTPGKGSLIMSEVWLPENWNGILIGLGNGGMAGGIDYGSLSHYIRNGYAAAHTDMGTSRGTESGIDNPDVWKDFGWRATHIMTDLAKTVLREYYGKKESYSYFIGASTGGQQAYSEAQRFPHDYDGILAGVPANNRVFLHTYFLWNHTHLRTKDGRIMFSNDEINTITDCAAKFFSGKDENKAGDDFVTYPYNGTSTVEDFLAFLGRETAFNEEQICALRAVYNGPKNPKTGKQIYNGMPIGSEIYGCGIANHQESESPHYYPFIWTFGKDYCGHDFDFADDMEKISDTLSADLNANNPDLSAFYNNGSKLLAYSGSADPCVPYPDAMQYYNRVADIMGKEQTASFFKFFLLPGRDHGGGGRGANREYGKDSAQDLLDVIRAWREDGIEPEYITAARVYETNDVSETIFERKIYPYNAEKTAPDTLTPVCDEDYLNR